MIEGQLNTRERNALAEALRSLDPKPTVVLEVGTWYGGGSTLTILRTLHELDSGRLYGIEADPSIYQKMIQNIQSAAPEAADRFTPLFGLSQKVIPGWLNTLGPKPCLDMAFLDGGDNPMEQVTELQLIADVIPVGGFLFAHDAKRRKGKWLVPYLSLLDNWECQLLDISDEGLFQARKKAAQPTPASLRSAKSKLRKLRMQPVELVGRYTPKPLATALLKCMPSKMRLRISQGRR